MNTIFTLSQWMMVTLMTMIILSKLLITHLSKPSRKVYLVDFSCYKPQNSQSITRSTLLERLRLACNLTEASFDFCKRVMDNSGLGESTYMADALLTSPLPLRITIEESRKEAEGAVFEVAEEVLRKTGVAAGEVGIVVANCSIFGPVPSLSAMLVNRFGMREDVKTFNLSGMGCTASLCAISLANQLLQVNENTYALVVSTEIISENAYMGHDRAMQVMNCVFRVGSAAILLSNRPSAAAKYLLRHTVPTHTAGSNPPSYTCIFQQEDSDGLHGIFVGKNLLSCANRAIRANITALGPLVLPISAQFLYFSNLMARTLLRLRHLKPYTPNFKLTFDHVFPHVGGKPVLDELARALGLDDVDMEPARMTLYRFGNTSSSSTWYEMAYAEAKGRVKEGDRVWQLAFGSGFKCCSLVWTAVRSVECKEDGNPWSDEIDRFPVDGEHLSNDGAGELSSGLFEPSE